MSDKENDAITINQSEEFQTFSKNIKDSNKNRNNDQASLSKDKENYEFTFKKNLFKKNIKTQDNQQNRHFINEHNENSQKSKSILCNKNNNNYIENNNILKILFQKSKNTIFDTQCNTVIINNYNDKGKKTPINYHYKSNNNNNLFIRNKMKKKNKNNENINSNSNNNNYKDINKNKSHIMSKYALKPKNINNFKNTSIQNIKNHSFIVQKNKFNISQNDFLMSYKAKIKKNISAKIIKSINVITENNKNNYNQSLKNFKTSSQKVITYNNLNNINKQKKEIDRNNLKKIIKCNNNKYPINHKGNILIINEKKINKNKLEKTPLSCKNQARYFYIKENNNNNIYISNPYINVNKNYNSKINSSIFIKKNRTYLQLINKNKKSPFIKCKNQINKNKKLTPDKKVISTLFNKNK